MLRQGDRTTTAGRNAATRYKRILKQHKADLAACYGVKALALFGSYVHGTQTRRSDLDVLVEFEERRTPSLFEFIALEQHLTDLLGVKVDLVEKEALKPRIGERILAEAVPI